MGIEKFRFDGKRALVVGGATGMGNAAAVLLGELGADVDVADVREPARPAGTFHALDLRDKESIDRLLDHLHGPFHVVLSCAGVAEGTPGLAKINFIGHRHLLESALEQGLLGHSAVIGMIASIGGARWLEHLEDLSEFLDTPDFDTASKWADAHPDLVTYRFTKEAMIAYCARRAPALSREGIRINCIAPGPTLTPLMAATQSWTDFEQRYHEVMGQPGSTPEEQAYPLVFLCSDAASYINGTCLTVDGGFISAGVVGAIKSPVVDEMLT